jgi:hypothetical protein
MTSPQDFFSNIKFEPKKNALEELAPEVPEPFITYPSQHWPALTPDAASVNFVQNFKQELPVFVSAFTHSVSPASIKKNKTNNQIFIASLTRPMRSYCNYQAGLIYQHKNNNKKHPDLFSEIVCKYSEMAGCILYTSIASYLGFKTILEPDYALYADRDLGDIRVGRFTLDHKFRNESYNDGCFLDADYFDKHDVDENDYYVHTTGLKKWEIEEFKIVNKAYEVAICGFFDKKTFMEKSGLRRNGERRVLDIPDMCDLEQLFTLVIKGLLEEEGYLK